MNLRLWFALCLFVSGATLGWAQNFLVVEHKGEGYIVQKVYNGFVYIKEAGKLISLKKERVMLAPAPEFLPVFVSVRNLKVSTSYLTLGGAGSDINNTFHLQADFASQYALPDAYLVIELRTENAGRQIYWQEIGTITPDHPRSIQAHVPLSEKLGPGNFQLHVFTGPREVFHSEQPWQFREAQLDGMVQKRIAGVTNASPQPFVGPSPDYPKAFYKSRTAGSARLKIHITRTGVVTDPVIVAATDPAFGEAAVEAVRQWRFLPRIKDGHPAETDAEMPFDFAAPADPKKS